MCTYDTDVKLCDLQHINIICDQHFLFTVIAQFMAHFIAHQEALQLHTLQSRLPFYIQEPECCCTRMIR